MKKLNEITNKKIENVILYDSKTGEVLSLSFAPYVDLKSKNIYGEEYEQRKQVFFDNLLFNDNIKIRNAQKKDFSKNDIFTFKEDCYFCIGYNLYISTNYINFEVLNFYEEINDYGEKVKKGKYKILFNDCITLEINDLETTFKKQEELQKEKENTFLSSFNYKYYGIEKIENVIKLTNENFKKYHLTSEEAKNKKIDFLNDKMKNGFDCLATERIKRNIDGFIIEKYISKEDTQQSRELKRIEDELKKIFYNKDVYLTLNKLEQLKKLFKGVK